MMDFQARCPSCGFKPMGQQQSEIDIPYAGKVLELSLVCSKCRYRTSSIDYLEQRPPVRYRFVVRNPEDLETKVYRSKYGFMEIPELGLKVEPGRVAEGYLTNVEGVLNRFRDVIAQFMRFNEGQDDAVQELARARDLLEKIEQVKEGKLQVTLVLTDPFGISSIDSEEARREAMTEEEAGEFMDQFVIVPDTGSGNN